MHDSLFVALQRIAPQNLISRFAGLLANSENSFIKNQFIEHFIKRYDVNMEEALEPNPLIYKSFNDFFTRALKHDARPISTSSIVCPADGAISQLGDIHKGKILQAKGHDFSLHTLLGNNNKSAEPFVNGKFMTVYLSPKDYHRVHIPCAGTLDYMTHIPGKIFSVNQATTENLNGLFARNERLVCGFKTEHGPMVVVLVGAMIVASIETTWAGLVTPIKKQVRTTQYNNNPITFNKGDEIGRFLLGSTAIILLPEHAQWDKSLLNNQTVKMGQGIGSFNNNLTPIDDQ